MANTPALEHVAPEVRAFAMDLIASARFTRLKGISFLGAIERFRGVGVTGGKFAAGSRYDHSIGVAELVGSLQSSLSLSLGERHLALAHALLHDIGHGPFSHSSEYFFSSVFGIDHHKVLQSIVEDETSDVSKILRRHGLWFDYRRFVRQPSTHPIVASLFYGPINVDTIEGILRSARFFDIQISIDSSAILQSLRRRNVAVKPLDLFWSLKSKVYNEHILHSDYSQFDRLLCDALFSVRDEVREPDFALNDEQFEERYHRAIHHQLQLCQFAFKNERRGERRFEINRNIVPTRFPKLGARYFEARGENVRSDRTRQQIHRENTS